ncbi:MAG: tRNA 2-thiouridine(34) synthase MnmA [Clostridiales bacterium]|nr:tRNA 2-thiouridine(34) synthase MnmA [Clostridiales bacterium]
MLDKNKVVVAMSGGVDSSAVACMLKEKGMEVIGLHMKVWGTVDEESERDFISICEKLEIPYHIIDLSQKFKKHVIDYFILEYQKGRTPNPCVACNKYIKFGAMLEEAYKLGAFYLATGHYAKIVYDGKGEYTIEKANSESKDQTYMFYNLTQDILQHVLMPLGEMNSKEDVREIVSLLDLELHKKKDSQEICFIPDDDYVNFLNQQGIISKPGDFIDKDEKILGRHEGIIKYTIGQRKGLGVTFGKPMYVIDIKSKKKQVILGDNSDLMSDTLIVKKYNFISNSFLKLNEISAKAKIRYSAHEESCIIQILNEHELQVVFENPLRAITPGQSIVFYIDSKMIGGGIIEKTVHN